jgi:GTPase SAR1 family protein
MTLLIYVSHFWIKTIYEKNEKDIPLVLFVNKIDEEKRFSKKNLNHLKKILYLIILTF